MIQGTGKTPLQKHFAALFSLLAFNFFISLAAAGTVQAQNLQRQGGAYYLPPGSMPSWTVPVLKLVSSTHVEPTTGIVISDTGLVLVPEDFARVGDEIIVLDGGTDIIRNGRPARIEQKFPAEGLQVLAVDGLKRNGVTLAAGYPEEGGEIVLTAFPPAEQIAQGEPPLSLPASIVVFRETGNPAISGETPLPNVTGGLVDRCGSLVGVSVADDVQSMEHSPATRYQWRKGLLYILGELQITAREFDCSGLAEKPAPEPDLAEPEIAEPEKIVPEPEEPPVQEDVIPEEEPATEQVLDTEQLPEGILPPLEQDEDNIETSGEKAGPGKWPWLIAALILIGLGLVLHRLRRSGAGPSGDATESRTQGPGTGFQDEAETEAPPPLPGSLLLIRGVLADGTPFEDSCPVSENAINITIGRNDADLRIESPAVSRRHVNLNGTRLELTVADLGSSNGTSINGVPCLEGEIMFIEPGDTLVLGDAKCTIEIRPRDFSGSGKE